MGRKGEKKKWKGRERRKGRKREESKAVDWRRKKGKGIVKE